MKLRAMIVAVMFVSGGALAMGMSHDVKDYGLAASYGIGATPLEGTVIVCNQENIMGFDYEQATWVQDRNLAQAPCALRAPEEELPSP